MPFDCTTPRAPGGGHDPIPTRRRRVLRGIACCAALCALAACASQPPPVGSDFPGFFTGLLHGIVSPFALIYHLFDEGTRVYAFPNAGGWYDFGFLLGIGTLGGGAGSQS